MFATIFTILLLFIFKCNTVEIYEKEESVEVIKNETQEVQQLQWEDSGNINLGKFKMTAYCACFKCCRKNPGDPGYGITKSGAVATEGRTVAVDPTVIPLGSKIIFDGHEYIAEDTGSGVRGNHIDVFFVDHEAAFNFGVQYKEVILVTGGDNLETKQSE